MLKKVIHDYLGYLRWGNIRRVYSNIGTWWIYPYMLTIFPLLTDIDESSGLAAYYMLTIPMLFAIMTLTVVPMKLPKQMFLCPMEEQERRRYIQELFAVRLLIPFLIGAIGSFVVLVMKKGHPLILCLEILALISLLLCGSITSWEGSVWSNEENGNVKRVKDKRLKGLVVINVLGVPSSIIALIINTTMMENVTALTMGDGIYIGISTVILVVLDILVVRYYPVILEMAVDYERTMKLEKTPPKR